MPLVTTFRPAQERTSQPPQSSEPSHSTDLPLAPVIPPAIQRTIAALENGSSAPSIQQESVVVMQRQEAAPAPAAESAPAAAPAAGAEAVAQSEQHMDELAGKLYDRIRTRLRSELLVDRERAGFLTDLR
jgi:hypothetical protein